MTACSQPDHPWVDEEKYRAHLDHERHMFAWCLVNCLDKSRDEATDAALAFYAYEPAIDAYRGLVFHDEAWHWAMRRFVGEGYWRNRPDLAEPSAEYRAESLEFGKSRGA